MGVISNTVLLFVLVFAFSNGSLSKEKVSDDETVVQLPQGKIRGRIAKTNKNVVFYAFQEVPFAAKPIGKLRFMPPVEPPNWDGILDTTKNTKVCLQWGSTSGTEDCLYLNVYTPVKPGSNESLPVLVFLYGGAFLFGSATYGSIGPDYLLNHKIVVVTPNYRVGPFGFLSTQDEVILGNQGLKDQTFALKWVQKNIHLFGGDPTKVTIDGQSAGASSVGMQIISKKAAGLFRGAIIESGAAVSSLAYQRYAKSVAYEMCHAINSSCNNSTSSQEILRILQEADANKINTAKVKGPPELQIGQGFVFAPVVEANHPDALITEKMHVILEKGDFNRVPLLIGFNSEERIFEIGNLDGFRNLMKFYDENLKMTVPEDLNVKPENVITVAKAFRSLYTEGLYQNDLAASIRYKSDVRYCLCVVRHATLQSAFTPVYLYQFSYHGKLNHNDAHIDGAERVGHSEELNYLWKFSSNSDLSKYPAEDVETLEKMTLLWTNFVKELNPTPKQTPILNNVVWPKLTPNKLSYVNINSTLIVSQDPKLYKKWIEIIDKYGQPPYDTF